jgi:hypothetical protein
MGSIDRAVEDGDADATVSPRVAPQTIDTGNGDKRRAPAAGLRIDFPGRKTRTAVESMFTGDWRAWE